jgi:hypothetical protein
VVLPRLGRLAIVVAWAGFALGIVIVCGTAASVFSTLVVPRGATSRLSTAIELALDTVWVHPALLLPKWQQRDRALAVRAPLFLMLQLGAWLTLFLTGFGLIGWPQTGSMRGGFVLAGSSMFTLGFASTPTDSVGLVTTAYLCAATGLIAVALQISYLPTLYAAFNRRETLVTMLESRGGDPVWGPEILARHVLVDIVDNLPQLYTDWERWAAEISESHTNYHVLVWFRSPNPLRSWVVALMAVLDAAALQMALNPLTAPSECRLVLRMGFTSLRDIARALHIPFNPDPMPDDPIQIDIDEFRRAVEHLEQAGWVAERGVEEAYSHFRGWRVNYEQIVWALADRVEAPPALWSGPRRHARVLAIAPKRPTDRRPAVEQRNQLAESARKRRAARAMKTGQTLPAALRKLAQARADLEAAEQLRNEARALLDGSDGGPALGGQASAEAGSAEQEAKSGAAAGRG